MTVYECDIYETKKYSQVKATSLSVSLYTHVIVVKLNDARTRKKNFGC